jgi:hypothetical protein
VSFHSEVDIYFAVCCASAAGGLPEGYKVCISMLPVAGRPNMINFTGEMRRNERYCGKANIERMSVQGAFFPRSAAEGAAMIQNRGSNCPYSCLTHFKYTAPTCH